MTVIHEWTALYGRRRFACLFFSLLVSLMAAPVLTMMGFSARFMETFVGLNILAAALPTLVSIRLSLVLGLLSLILVTRLGYGLFGYESFLVASQGGGITCCLLAILIMGRFMLSAGRVDSERIFAALNIYLLMGIMCGLLFTIFEEQWPGSLSAQGSSLPGEKKIQMAHTIYFSFVTLGTLGYGDILPVSGPARALAVTESISGQMYLVVIVARLVSLYREHPNRNDPVHPD